MVWAVLPLKDFVSAKQRLSGVLAAHERRHLFHTMVEDVLSVLAGHPAIEQVLVVSDDPSAALLAEHYGVLCWSEFSLGVKGLSAVVDATANQLAAQGVDTMLVVHGDLPLLSGNDIQQLVDTHQAANFPAITIAPDTVGDGSNCMLLSPPNAILLQYGEGSFEKHQAYAEAKLITVNTLLLAGAAHDIDNPSDLQLLLQLQQSPQLQPQLQFKLHGEGKHTLKYLGESGIGERLNAMLHAEYQPNKKAEL